MNRENALALSEAAIKTALEMGISISVAVYGRDAHLVCFQRMEDAMLGTIDVACRKAKTSALFPLSTSGFGSLCEEEKLAGMLATNGGLVGFGGGVPLPEGGGIGVSGGTAEQDELIAKAAIAGKHAKI